MSKSERTSITSTVQHYFTILSFQSFLRTCCLRQFGYFLSGLDGLQFSYHDDKGIFIGPAQPTAEDEVEQEVAMEKMVCVYASELNLALIKMCEKLKDL